MRTSLNEIKLIDDHLFSTCSTEDSLLFDALLILDSSLPEKVGLQKATHAIVTQYGRKMLKAEIETVHRHLFSQPEHQSFRQKILSLFLIG